MRQRNRTSTHTSVPRGKRLWSLTGLTFCWQCEGRVHTQYVYRGQPRLGCYNRQKGWGCPQKSANLSVYEVQLETYLGAFHIPVDYQVRILEYHRKLETAYSDAERERAVIERRLKRARELYEWSDYTRAEYETRRDDLLKQLDDLAPRLKETDHLDKLARFLDDVPAAWEVASQEQRTSMSTYTRSPSEATFSWASMGPASPNSCPGMGLKACGRIVAGVMSAQSETSPPTVIAADAARNDTGSGCGSGVAVGQRGSPLVILDLAVPRDVEPLRWRHRKRLAV